MRKTEHIELRVAQVDDGEHRTVRVRARAQSVDVGHYEAVHPYFQVTFAGGPDLRRQIDPTLRGLERFPPVVDLAAARGRLDYVVVVGLDRGTERVRTAPATRRALEELSAHYARVDGGRAPALVTLWRALPGARVHPDPTRDLSSDEIARARRYSRAKRVPRLLTLVLGLAVGIDPAAAQKKYDPGVTDSEIRIGNIMPYSGPLSAYALIGRTQAAFFNKIKTQKDFERTIQGALQEWLTPVAGYCT